MKVPSRYWSAALLLGASLAAAAGLPGGSSAAAPPPPHVMAAPIPGIPGLSPRLSPLGASVPRPGHTSYLNGVYCVSARNCWAVGQYDIGSSTSVLLNQVLHWNGGKWSTVPAPNPGGTAANADSSLTAVRCPSAGDCWAVGFYVRNHTELNQALHWNGKHWSRFATPNPGGTGGSTFDFNELISVTCTSSKSCWAAGEYGHALGSTETILNEMLHWNGTKWSKTSVPSPAGTSAGDESALESVRCTSPDNCWADGISGTEGSPGTFFNEMLHWNGTTWATVIVPSPGGTASGDYSNLAGVGCTSAANCWAVGSYGSVNDPETFQNQALHWNGHQWSLTPTPQPDGTGPGASNILEDVACGTADNCWAVGNYDRVNDNVGFVLNQILHWNGHHWSLTSSPDPAGISVANDNELSGVRCATPRSCWAVGLAQVALHPTFNEALRWNGSKWSIG